MKRLAFVTGASGFLGRYVAKCLAGHGFNVAGIGHDEWLGNPFRDWGIDVWRTASISLESLEVLAQEIGEPTVVAHCAGGASVKFSLTNPAEDFHMTVSSTVDVLEFARGRAPAVSIVYPSSAAVYGATAFLPLREDMPLDPVSPYGLHKRIVEELCRYYAAHWNVPVALIRFFSLYGEGLRKQLLWDACSKARDGAFSFFGTGDELRDWLHVSDAAELFYVASEKAGLHCPVVNGGTGGGHTVREVLTRIGLLWSPTRAPEFSRLSKPGDPCHLVADIQHVQSWGFTPRVELASGLSAYVRWFRREFCS
ncbi:MAG: NAD-dependent epimerase/dehydratase family protein [Syntrophobacteraceae bacterium]